LELGALGPSFKMRRASAVGGLLRLGHYDALGGHSRRNVMASLRESVMG